MIKLISRLDVFRRPRGRAAIQRAPVVAGHRAYLGAFDEIVEVDTVALRVDRRDRVPGLRPSAMAQEHLLVLTGDEELAVWDTTKRRVEWRRPFLGYARWGGLLVVSTETGIEILNPATGVVERVLHVEGEPGGLVALDTAIVVTRESGSTLRCCGISTHTWREIWHRDLLRDLEKATGTRGSPRFLVRGSGFTLVVGCPGYLCGMSGRDGSLTWTVAADVPYQSFATLENMLVVLSDQRLVVANQDSGALLCDREFPELWKMVQASPGAILPSRGIAVFLSEAGEGAAFDVKSGELVWHERYDVSFQGLSVAGQKLLAAGSDGRLWIFEAA